MNKNKVYIEGYEVGFSVDTTGAREKKIQVASGEIVSIDERFIYKSIERDKVKVPQFVAEHIKRAKEIGRDLQDAMNSSSIHEEVDQWLYTDNNMDTFARAWLDGYIVEEEKRYLVKTKGMSEENTYLTFRFGHTWMLSNFEECEEFRLHHTRKQLEETGFGWVFDCPGIEIEEVE